IAEIPSPPVRALSWIATLAAFDNLAGSKASHTRAWVSSRIICLRLRTGCGRLVRRSIELRCGGGSFLDLLDLKDFPIFQRNYRRLDVSNNLSFSRHESEDIVIRRLDWNDLDDGLPAFGHDYRFAGCLNV